MGRERTGRKIRKESRVLDEILKKVVKEKIKEKAIIVQVILCDRKGYSLSDYERFMKWYNDFPKGRRIEIGLLIDILQDLGIDWKEVIEEALRRRSYG